MKQIITQALAKTEHHSTKEIEQILKAKLPKFEAKQDFSEVWQLSDFRLEKATLIQSLPQTQQKKILHNLSRDRFVEAFQIEKAGMSFATKMSLLSQSLNEQKLYNLFAAEEAQHYHFIQGTLGHDFQAEQGPFVELLNEIIISGERQALQFIIQIVLEGWGIEHYSLMMKTCQDPALKKGLQNILLDEAAHHGSGLSLFDESRLEKADLKYIVDMMRQFLDMVRIGPVGMLQVLNKELGELSPLVQSTLLEETQAHADTEHKLKLLKSLIKKAGATQIYQALEEYQAFDLLF